MKKRFVLVIILIIFLLAITLFLIRFFSEKQLDDVSPEIPCEKELLEKADILYIIPKFENKSIADNKKWCEEISALNKTLALHGVYHTYKEFLVDRNEEYLQEGIDIFRDCFNINPTRFKPPHLKISKSNKNVINKRMKPDLTLNQILHKVYHCNDSGKLPNWFMNLF
jgi:hypothetical protein